ncbi:hypothetical protein [Stenotrophomonas maltophilia]|uniref:hypothetical protein n=1 Tax=Stenotrophomonas maltophilia TaxID=40324 RepID=UPI003D7EF7CE
MSPALALVLVFLLAPMVLIARAEWASRRRRAFAELRRQPPCRVLSDNEDAALAVVRALTGCAHDHQVRVVSGAFGNASLFGARAINHADLGEIPVLLPFDAWRHIATDNHAEVVLADGMAVVVRLNGFHIVGAQRRADRAAAVEEAPFEPLVLRPRRHRVHSLAPSEVLGMRMESAAEVRLRRHRPPRWTGLLVALLALGAAAALHDDSPFWLQLLLCSPLLAIAALALWLSRPRRRGPAVPQRVLQVRGRLADFALHPQHPPLWLIGSDRRIELPAEWLGSGHFVSGRCVRLDVRESDGVVLGAGPHWSRVEDHHHYPPSGALWPLAWLGMMLVVLLFGGTSPDLISDAGAARADAWRLWWLLALAITLWQPIGFLRRTRHALRRTARYTAALAKRPPPAH